jgi:5-methyltetrahydrofolate--homocysteine methyltransferase
LRTILGVSNISYGFKPEARKVLNSIFLYEAVKAGLNAAIVHAGQILPLHKIDKEAAKLALDLIHCKKSDALKRFTQHFERVIPAKLVPACSKQGAGIQRISRDPRFRGNDHESILTNHIIDGNKTGLEETIGNVLKKLQAEEIINKVLLPAMQVVGERFGSNELPLPFVLQSAETMRTAVDILKPYLKAGESACRGTIVLATVRGDVHDIGKNLVDIILSNNGYKVINLGVKQPAHEVIESALKHKADAIGLSGLIVQSCMVMKEDLAEMAHRKLNIPVICGGAALTKKFVENDLQKAYDGKVYYARDAFDGLKIMDIIASKAEQSREPTGPPRP